jgi:hypothetical protein
MSCGGVSEQRMPEAHPYLESKAVEQSAFLGNRVIRVEDYE